MQDWCCSYCGYSWLCELFQKKKSVEVGDKIEVTDNPEIINAIEQLKEARTAKKEIEAVQYEAKQILDENVKAKGIKALCGGDLILTLTTGAKSSIDEKSLREKHPDIYNEFRKETPYVTYKVKEA